jgi:hypothetical protein
MRFWYFRSRKENARTLVADLKIIIQLYECLVTRSIGNAVFWNCVHRIKMTNHSAFLEGKWFWAATSTFTFENLRNASFRSNLCLNSQIQSFQTPSLKNISKQCLGSLLLRTWECSITSISIPHFIKFMCSLLICYTVYFHSNFEKQKFCFSRY